MMTYAPARLLELRRYLQPITGLSDAELGITPDPLHNGGYHCGWDRRRIVNGVLDDYSWQESSRDSSHRTDAASAFDLGMFPRLRDFSVWLVGECAKGAPDTLDIREVIYSPDGRTVERWDRLGRRSSGDNSHLTHTHISFFRDAEDRPKTPVFKRFFGDDEMALSDPLAGYGGKSLDDAESDTLKTVHWLWSSADGSGDQVPKFDLPATSRLGGLLADVAELKARPPVQLTDEQLASIAEQAAALLGGTLKAELAGLELRLKAELRDAVADLGEGGAAAVRADAT